MVLTTRVLDAVIMGEEAAQGTEAATYDINDLGDIVTCTLTTDEDRRVLNGLKGGTTTGHLPTRIVALKASPQGTITFHPHTLQFFKYVISDFTTGVGTYTMDNRDISMPTSLSLKGAYDGTKGVKHLGCYLNNIRPTLNDEDILTITADIVSIFSETFTGAVAYSPPTTDPLIYADGVFTIDGNEWDLQGLNLGYNPKFIQKYGVNTKASTKRRFPSSIIRGAKAEISFDGVANIEDATNEIEVAWGGTSAADNPVDSTLLLTFTDSLADTHVITITGQIIRVEDLQSDSEENSKTISFTGVGIDFTVSGTRP